LFVTFKKAALEPCGSLRAAFLYRHFFNKFSISVKRHTSSRQYKGGGFMKDFIISPLYDFVFKEIFGNQQNIGNTRAFLKTLLDIPEDEYDRLTVVSSGLRKLFRGDKGGLVDLKLTTKSGKIIHIELQVQKKSDMRNRVLYYAVRLIGDQIKLGEDYEKLHQVISIVICDHNLLEEEDCYINEYQLRNKKNNSFTKLLKIVILELPKLPETDNNAVWRWLYFLKCKSKEEFEMLAKKYPEMKEAVSCVKKISLLERLRYHHMLNNLAKTDRRMLLKQQWLDGKAEGKAEGMTEGKLETARNALAKGLPLEVIHEITNLDIDTIKNLQAK
jgi:predicted transposase/invertase (TIGR01784 family)